MGVNNSIKNGQQKSQSMSPHRDKEEESPGKSSSVYAEMAKKVLQSREKLFVEHDRRSDKLSREPSYDLNADIYYDFLTRREEGHDATISKDEKEAKQEVKKEAKKSNEATPALKSFAVDSNKLKMRRSGSAKRISITSHQNNVVLSRRGKAPTVPAGYKTKMARSKSITRDPTHVHSRDQLKKSNATEVINDTEKSSVNKTSVTTPQEESKAPAPPVPSTKPPLSGKPPVPVPRSFPKSSALRQKHDDRLPKFDRVSLLPSYIFMKILSYCVDNFRQLLTVNPAWYVSAVTAFDNHFNSVENGFVSTYSGYLLFKDSYTSSSIMCFCGTVGVRIDRVIKCENLSSTLGKALTISYTYKYCNEPKTTYRSEFTFDSVTRAPRCVWLHKNECLFHTDDVVRASTQPVMPICVGDNIELAVNFYSLRGLVDATSIKWEAPTCVETPQENVLTYQRVDPEEDKSRKIVADLSRICELEDSQSEWRSPLYEPLPPQHTDFRALQPFFIVKDMEFANVDILVLKVHLLAAQQGELQSNALGIGVKVMGYEEECTNEVRRVGLLIERHCDLEVRVGDLVIFYVSKSPAKK